LRSPLLNFFARGCAQTRRVQHIIRIDVAGRPLLSRVLVVALLACGVAPPEARSQAPLPFGDGVATVQVPADVEWTDTGIDLLPGDVFRIRVAAGQRWSNAADPASFAPSTGLPDVVLAGTRLDAPPAALLARVGDLGSAMLARSEPVTPVTTRGRLYLGMNDVPGQFDDNRGAIAASIQYVRLPAPLIDLKAFTVASATEWLARYGFSPRLDYVESENSRDVVAGQTPAAGTDLHGVAEVRLTVSAGPAGANGGESEAWTTVLPWKARLAITVVVLLAVAVLTEIAVQLRDQQRKLKATRQRTSLAAAVDGAHIPALEPLPVCGPPVLLAVSIDLGELTTDGTVPVLHTAAHTGGAY
jgi:hypothetical protein